MTALAAPLLAGGLLAFVLASALLVPQAASPAATRGLAAAAATLAAAGLAAGSRAPWLAGVGRLPAVCALTLAALALLGGRPLWLELLPASIWGCVALAFARSLREPQSLVERLARRIDPRAPDFIAPYCRSVTWLYVVLCMATAGLIALLALLGAHDAWRWFSGVGAWLALAAFQLTELVARKLHFRNYGRGPLDRALARAFPPERTARGRRSMAYLHGLARADARLRVPDAAGEPGDSRP